MHPGPGHSPPDPVSSFPDLHSIPMKSLSIAGVIPARLASTRLSRKVLRELAGRPMVEWVWRAAMASDCMDPVVVATDAGEVAEACRQRGIPVVMTSPGCASGSDRVREVARTLDADVFVNIQGDEPTLTGAFFPALLALFERPEVQVATLAVSCPDGETANPNAVRSEEHTSASHTVISYAVFCLKKKKTK